MGRKAHLRKAFIIALMAFYTPCGWADYVLNMREGVTSISREVYSLHMLILWICVVIGIVVFGVMLYSIIRHRKSRGVVAAQFREKTSVEILWTVVPFLILVGMAVPATRALMVMEDTSDPDLTIKVTGYQWKWHYHYLDDDIHFFSNLTTPSDQMSNKAPKEEDYLLSVDNPVVVPINKKIRFLTTANDVIHSWWVPDLGWKRDAIPGFINESWARIDTPGIYRGQCAELCGRGHAFMPIVVIAKTESGYQQWVQEQKAALRIERAAGARTWGSEELLARGETVYNTSCAICHQAGGVGVPGAFPALKGSPLTTGPLEAHIRIVLDGRSGTAMQAFGAQLSDVDLAAVITYERNAFGNDTGDIVQPAQVQAAR